MGWSTEFPGKTAQGRWACVPEQFRYQLLNGYFSVMDANDLLCMAWKWPHGDVSRHTGGDLWAALGRIKAFLAQPSRRRRRRGGGAVAQNSIGAPAEALALLERAHEQHPTDRDTLMALVSIARHTGDFALALRHARELVTLNPGDAQLRALVSDLEKSQAH
jgi:hypothetical protein